MDLVEGVGGKRLASMTFRSAPPPHTSHTPVLALSFAASGERICQAHFCALLPRSFLPLLPPEPSYPPFPAALLSPPSGCPSLAPKVTSFTPSLLLQNSGKKAQILPADHPGGPAQSRLVPGVQPWASHSQERCLEAQTGRGLWGRQEDSGFSRHDPSSGWSSGS